VWILKNSGPRQRPPPLPPSPWGLPPRLRLPPNTPRCCATPPPKGPPGCRMACRVRCRWAACGSRLRLRCHTPRVAAVAGSALPDRVGARRLENALGESVWQPGTKIGMGFGSARADAPSPQAAACYGCWLIGCAGQSRSGDSKRVATAVPVWQACAGEPAAAIRAGRAKPSRVAAGSGKRTGVVARGARGRGGCHMECGNRRA